MRIGFTGTRYGMSEPQSMVFRGIAGIFKNVEQFHHGSCMGADVEAARIVREELPDCWIVAHPGPDGDPCRAISGVDNETREPLTHFARNRNIVNECGCLIATPLEMEAQSRGGTWYTINYAKKAKKPVAIAQRDGTALVANGPVETSPADSGA